MLLLLRLLSVFIFLYFLFLRSIFILFSLPPEHFERCNCLFSCSLFVYIFTCNSRVDRSSLDNLLLDLPSTFCPAKIVDSRIYLSCLIFCPSLFLRIYLIFPRPFFTLCRVSPISTLQFLTWTQLLLEPQLHLSLTQQ